MIHPNPILFSGSQKDPFDFKTRDVLDRLNAIRGPGESYSDVILRVAEETAR
jgi:hypothetical protein